MYPPGDATTITVGGPAERWEGDARPGHFRGVATVCAKLFGQVRPDRAYFGKRTGSNCGSSSRMVDDLLLPLTIVGIDTVREPDGLALSSRNRFLSEPERAKASLLPAAMTRAARAIADGGLAEAAFAAERARLTDAGFAVDYFALVDGPTLAPIAVTNPGARLIAAAKLGSVRLIDNIAA